MAADARLSTGLPSHPKTKKLIRRLGQSAAWSLVCLILWAADNRSDGDLSGMSIEDIELASDWLGEDGALVDALVAVRFLDGADGCTTPIGAYQRWGLATGPVLLPKVRAM